MRRDFFETLRLFCVLGALLIIGLVIFSALFAGCKPVNELQSSEAGQSVSTYFKIITVDGHDYIYAKDRGYCSIAIAHHGGCRKCAEERRRSVYEDMLCASTGVECKVESWTNVWTNVASSCGVDGKPIPRAVREYIDTEALKRELEAARNDIDIEALKRAGIEEAIRERERVKKLYGLQERNAE